MAFGAVMPRRRDRGQLHQLSTLQAAPIHDRLLLTAAPTSRASVTCILRAPGRPVDLDRYALRAGSRFGQVKRHVRDGGGEQPRALTDDHGADEQGDLVDQLVVEEPADQVAAAVNLQLASRLGFQLVDGRREVTGRDGRVRPLRVGERVRCDDLLTYPVVVGQGCSPTRRSSRHEARATTGCGVVLRPPGQAHVAEIETLIRTTSPRTVRTYVAGPGRCGATLATFGGPDIGCPVQVNPALFRSKLQARLRCSDQSCASRRDLGRPGLKTLVRDHGSR